MKWVVYRTIDSRLDWMKAGDWDYWLQQEGNRDRSHLRSKEVCRVKTLRDAINLTQLANDQHKLENER